MKCDELMKYGMNDPTIGDDYEMYRVTDVDEAIAELQAENQRLSNALDKEHSETIKYMDELCNAKNEIERLTIDKRNVELMADIANSTIEKLKKKMDDYHLMSDIRRSKIKELKRALWLARAERAVAAQSVHEWCRYNEKHPCGLWRADPFEYWVQAWIYVEKLCRKKAKEYK